MTPQATYVFDADQARRGAPVNRMCASLRDPANRQRFLADQAAYCAEFALTAQQTTAVLDQDWVALCDLGGSIFCVYKLAQVHRISIQQIGGAFTGMTEDEFVASMKAGGRNVG